MQLKPNALIERGKYRIIDALGHGGFGITYLAEQVMTKRKVCIKEFFPKGYYSREDDSSSVRISSQEFSENMERFKAKFIKEAQTIASLDHSNIIHIHDAFEENGTAYYVMEYVEGGSLRDIVKEQGPLSESDAKRYIRAVASALSYIHEQKINHLDVKPGNIMVRTKDDSAILIDFGLAKHYDIVGDQTSSTPVGISHGYAPIEQYTSGGVKEFSPSTDIYGLGATLYYLVTGEVPPHATDVGEEGLPKLPDHLSQGVHKAIERSMQYWRKDRPQSIKEFLKLLDDDKIVAPVAEATIINVETKSVDESTVIDVKPKQTPQPTPQPKPKKSKRGLWLGIFLFILAAVASFILFGGGSSKKESAPKSAVAAVDTLASSNDSLNLAKPKVDTLQLNDTLNEQPKPSETNLETETETKPEPPRNPGIRNETGSNFVSLSSNGGSGSIKYSIVNGNGSEVTYTNSGSSWLKSAKGDGKIEYNAGANTTGSERSATIKVMYANKSFEVVVTQSAAPVLTLNSATNETIKADGGSVKIKYTITNSVDGESVKYATDAMWLTLKPNDGVVSCTAQANTTDKKRSATVTLTYCDQSVKVNISQDTSTPPNNEIWYTSSDGKVVKPYKEGIDIFGAVIESNTYKDGKGILKFKDDVTTIGENAFYWCKSLTSVTIPNSVTTIVEKAFYDCYSLKEFKSKFVSDDGRCLIINGELVAFAPAGITEYTIPNSVTTIGVCAFYGCKKLKSVTIPNSVTTIGEWAFYYCESLTSVTIPNSVKTIGEYAFNVCRNLTSVTIPNSVTTIGNGAFSVCESLKSVTIPNSVTTIGDEAFRYCYSLTSVTIPNSVTTIGYVAFGSCYNLNLSNETMKRIISINPEAFELDR